MKENWIEVVRTGEKCPCCSNWESKREWEASLWVDRTRVMSRVGRTRRAAVRNLSNSLVWEGRRP